MPFVVALFCWFVLSIPAALVVGRVLALRSAEARVPGSVPQDEPTRRILVHS
jgi:hypothetical protein